jgi:hypothetical protein
MNIEQEQWRGLESIESVCQSDCDSERESARRRERNSMGECERELDSVGIRTVTD